MNQLDLFNPGRQFDLFDAPPPPFAVAAKAPTLSPLFDPAARARHDERLAQLADQPAATDDAPESDAEYSARRRREADESRAEWEAFCALVERGTDRETVGTGDRTKPSKPYFHIGLIRLEDGWHTKTDYSFTNGGGGGPFGRRAYATRDEALTDALRKMLADMAKDEATGQRGYPPAWRKWALDVAPSALFGGADLAGEYDALVTLYRQRNALRCAAIRAADGVNLSGVTYIDEAGSECSIYSL